MFFIYSFMFPNFNFINITAILILIVNFSMIINLKLSDKKQVNTFN